MKNCCSATLMIVLSFFGIICFVVMSGIICDSYDNEIKFTKGFIDLRDVKKHPLLYNENEQLTYWYRYNANAAAAYYRKPKIANEHSQKFRAFKYILGETRFYEVMHLADSDYPFK